MPLVRNTTDACHPLAVDDLAGLAVEFCLRLPDVAAIQAPGSIGEIRGSADVSRGMQVLNRVLGERTVKENWRRSWSHRLWQAAAVLACLSGVALVAGFVQRENQTNLPDDDLAAQAQLDREPGHAAPRSSGTPGDSRGPTAEQAARAVSTLDASAVVHSANYEAPTQQAARGAWFAGNIVTDETE